MSISKPTKEAKETVIAANDATYALLQLGGGKNITTPGHSGQDGATSQKILINLHMVGIQ